MRKAIASAMGLLFVSGAALAGVDVKVNVGVPLPPPVVVERGTVVVKEKETVVVKEKKDRGKHKGHYKHKGKK
jgi:hypothetical protein